MIIGITKEPNLKETRVAILPDVVKKFKAKQGIDVLVEKDLAKHLGYCDESFVSVGAKIIESSKEILQTSDVVLRVGQPKIEEIEFMKKGAVHISFLDPFNNPEIIQKFKDNQIRAFSMQMIPRSTFAQKMDALSSQASLAGYVAVVLAAERLKKIFPMMTTPSGTISPAKVFVIGAGVAGLQAIATAKRLGASVLAFDTRPVVEEQVKSLGARFLKIDLGQTEQTAQGYAKALTEEQLLKQQEAMAKACIDADVVITTAKLFGRKSPVLIKKEVVEKMKYGSVIVDLASDAGGNVEGTILDEIVEINGTEIIGFGSIERKVPIDASAMYANNLYALVSEFWNDETKNLVLDAENEIVKQALMK